MIHPSWRWITSPSVSERWSSLKVDLALAEGGSLASSGRWRRQDDVVQHRQRDGRAGYPLVLFPGRDITQASPAQRSTMGIGRSFQVLPFAGVSVFEGLVVAAAFGGGPRERDM